MQTNADLHSCFDIATWLVPGLNPLRVLDPTGNEISRFQMAKKAVKNNDNQLLLFFSCYDMMYIPSSK